MKLCDAHTHYHFPALAPQWAEVWPVARQAGVSAAVVNGTCEADWPDVAAFVRQHPWARPAYGIHPWQAPRRGAGWGQDLSDRLAADSRASVGEIGLDAWVEGHDLADQTTLLLRQWEVARDHQRPVTVHCVRAWEPLRQALRRMPSYLPGFLIHAYNGPPEWIPWFVEKGAYFSFPPYFLLERKRPQRDAFRLMPPERILIETDAPELSPPPEHNPHPLTDFQEGRPLNHPANLLVALHSLAGTLDREAGDVATLTTQNWERLFAPSGEDNGSR